MHEGAHVVLYVVVHSVVAHAVAVNVVVVHVVVAHMVALVNVLVLVLVLLVLMLMLMLVIAFVIGGVNDQMVEAFEVVVEVAIASVTVCMDTFVAVHELLVSGATVLVVADGVEVVNVYASSTAHAHGEEENAKVVANET